MTSRMLFAGLGALICVGVALAQTAIAGFGDAQIAFWPCAAACREWRETIAGEEALTSADRSQSAQVGGESQAVVFGRECFSSAGRGGCDKADSTSVGRTLDVLFGRPVQDPACGVAMVDESYLREAILNPSAHGGPGFSRPIPSINMIRNAFWASLSEVGRP